MVDGISVRRRKLSDYRLDPQNANAGTERGHYMLQTSIEQTGVGRSAVADKHDTFVAGNGTAEMLAEMGIEDVIEVETDGKTLVVVKRPDFDLTDSDPNNAARRYAYLDNRAGETRLSWDVEQLLADIGNGADLSSMWHEDELKALLGAVEDTDFTGGDDGQGDELPDEDEPLTSRDVPDVIFSSDNEWGVPLLNIHQQATVVYHPFTKWGQVARSSKMTGTYHFYTDDYKFNGLWADPTPIINSGCQAVIEPNFSTNNQMPRAVVLYNIWRKRWLARYWQGFGVKVFVDLNVEPEFDDLNLLGVPRGYKAYATRAYVNMISELERQYKLAQAHAETDDIVFLVYGGRDSVKQLANQYGWIHFPEQASEVHDGQE